MVFFFCDLRLNITVCGSDSETQVNQNFRGCDFDFCVSINWSNPNP